MARYGGEEFVVLLPGTALAGAGALAEQIRTTIAGARIRRGANHETVGNITVSLGVACWKPGERAGDAGSTAPTRRSTAQARRAQPGHDGN